MNYYDELGVPESATEEEIRRAYKKLARVLHPDQYQDEELRRVCERQLARLNGVVEVLGDEGRRREYDLAIHGRRSREKIRGTHLPATGSEPLAAASPECPRIFERRGGAERWVWMGAAAVGIGVMAWVFRPQMDAGEARPYREAVVAAAPAARKEAAPVKRVVVKQRPKAAAVVVVKTEVERPRVEAVPEMAAPVVVAQVPKKEAPKAAERVESYFAGRWYYSRELSERDASMYEPVMIELAITEANGMLQGKYLGRYRVPDRPISPVVRFSFTGTGPQELTWSGAGGAAGQIRLKAVTPLSMEVSWWATEMGALDLTSGTATLIRTVER